MLIENEKLKLENNDLTNAKQRYLKAKEDAERQHEKMKLEFRIMQEENKKLKFKLEQAEAQKQNEVEELLKDQKLLKDQLERYKTETEGFRDILKERSMRTSILEYPEKTKNEEMMSEMKRKRINDLLNYKLNSGISNGSFDNGEKNLNKWGPYEGGDEMGVPMETPSRSVFQPSSGEEALLRSTKRNFARVHVAKENKNSDDASKSSGDKDRNVYAGLKDDERDDELPKYQQKIMQSIERRVGGYEPVF